MKTKYKKEYVIDRSKWVCGGDFGRYSNLSYSQMLNDKKRMCCLGQICNISGVPKRLLTEAFPEDVAHNSVPSWMVEADEDGVIINSKITERMAHVNDDDTINQKIREYSLKNIAKSIGIKLIFKGRLGGILRKKK